MNKTARLNVYPSQSIAYLSALEKKLGYKFKNLNILAHAMTHSSYANDSRGKLGSNERLEFLGDSVLGIIVSTYIFVNCPMYPEGDLTKLRSSLVCEKTLSKFAKSINLGDFLMLSKGEKVCGGNTRPSILADAFESLIAAIYLDAGMDEAEKFVLRFVKKELTSSKPKPFRDYKTELQEVVQKNPQEQLSYILVSEIGPDHDKHFVTEVHLNHNVIGKGGGSSKKESEQQAAREALELMGY